MENCNDQNNGCSKRATKGVRGYMRIRIRVIKRCRYITRSVKRDFIQSIWKELATKCQSKDGNKSLKRKWSPFSIRWQNNSDSLDQLQTVSYLELLHKELKYFGEGESALDKVQRQHVVLLLQKCTFFYKNSLWPSLASLHPGFHLVNLGHLLWHTNTTDHNSLSYKTTHGLLDCSNTKNILWIMFSDITAKTNMISETIWTGAPQ